MARPNKEDPTAQPTPQTPDVLPEGSAQSAILLNVVSAFLTEELSRREQRRTGLRSELAVVGTLFAVVQAAVIALINGTLGAKAASTTISPTGGLTATAPVDAAEIVLPLTVIGALAAVVLAAAIYLAFRATAPGRDASLSTSALGDFVPYARSDNPAVAATLLEALLSVAEARRGVEDDENVRMRWARRALGAAIALSVLELVVALLAAGLR